MICNDDSNDCNGRYGSFNQRGEEKCNDHGTTKTTNGTESSSNNNSYYINQFRQLFPDIPFVTAGVVSTTTNLTIDKETINKVQCKRHYIILIFTFYSYN